MGHDLRSKGLAVAVAPRMNRLTLRFADAGLESVYAQEQARKALRPVRIALVCASALVLAYYVLTIHVFPRMVVGIGSAATLRLTISGVLLCALVYALTYRPVFLKRQQLIMFLVVCVMSAGIARASTRLPTEVLEARGFTIMLMHTYIIYVLFGLRFPQALLAGWLGVALFTGTLLGIELLSSAAIARSAFLLSLANCGGMVGCYLMDASARREFLAMRLLEKERERSERLLLNILPAPIAERLKTSDESIAEHSDSVTVLFADIAGFTELSARKTPHALVDLLNRVFTEFDALADVHGLEKIKTIGDAYMAVAGLPQPWPDHAARAARMALGMHAAITRLAAQTGEPLALRIGLHSGPVVAGVIGRKKFSYDLWGDTVNTASRMESHGVAGAVQCSEASATLLQTSFQLEYRGLADIKGKGEMRTYLLAGAAPGTGFSNG